ncbi:hypothetical protein PM10SUCC1_31850 [Propionigenium maris DSM 9537]|uniref:Uncharacterized protein n=1 Tax=Propionigenium maris DSM 9537 TaxID=1123000 RepID=A0A9W6GPK1_9FUSO|nr:hypothetical protein PM10SUCC1_31850 [Propionigenium maris DSM 9537]
MIELVVVMALAAILISTTSLSVSKVKERRALEESKNKVTEILRLYSDKSFNEGEVYEVTLDYTNKKIEVRDGDSVLIENEDLPSILEYYVNVDNDGIAGEEAIKTTKNGGLAKLNNSPINFSMYIFDLNEDARYRISVDGINSSKLAYVNVYKKKSSKEINLSNITSYTLVSSDWEKD